MGISPSGRNPSRVRSGASMLSNRLTSSDRAAPVGTTIAAASLRLDLNQRITAVLGDLSHLVDCGRALPCGLAQGRIVAGKRAACQYFAE